MEEPFPSSSLVISSPNHAVSIDPVVNDKVIFKKSSMFQLKTIGLTRNIAIPVLCTNAKPKARYRV